MDTKYKYLIRKIREYKQKENKEHFLAKDLFYDVDEIKDLNYMEDKLDCHKMDIYGPKNSTECLPVILMIHGGGYISCDKSCNEYQGKYFASKGFRVVNINYSLHPEASFIEVIQEVFSVLHWIAKHSLECCFDTTQICIYGDNAGGHYALLAAAVQKNKLLQGFYNVTPINEGIKKAAACCPMYELHSAKEKPDISSLFLKLCTLQNNRAKDCDYVDNVSIPTLLHKCEFPELFLLTTPSDCLLYKEAKELHGLLEQKHIKHIYKEYTSTERELGHIFPSFNPEYPESNEANDDILSFFQKN